MRSEPAEKGLPLRLLSLGEQGVVAEFGGGIAPGVNARVHRLAAVLKAKAIDGILETVPAYRSLLVLFDPLRINRDDLKKEIRRQAHRAESVELPSVTGRLSRVPVCYGGEFGPDLGFIAAHAGISEEEVIALHSGREYPVYMLGFMPGFPYLGEAPERIAVPRLETPRKRVKAGSVGIAGSQTGIYPVESPGGWRIIGRTPLRLFDPDRKEPFLIAAGDLVRFEPIERDEFDRMAAEQEERTAAPATRPETTGAVLEVVGPGLMTTVQDLGRRGFLSFGIPVSGAMDQMAARTANFLAGNPPDAALLEMTLKGGTFRFETEGYAAVCGADMGGTLNGVPIRNWSGFPVPAGGELSFGHARSGCRACLAVRGGIAVPRVLGSSSTLPRAGIGGCRGRALRRGDRLPIGNWANGFGGPRFIAPWAVPDYPAEITLRVIPGPQDDLFTREGIETFFGSLYTVTPRNDRMGYCLDGPPIASLGGTDIVSDPLCAGAVQVPGDGRPLVMGADHQTTGGYAKIGVVIGPDLPLLAQARQGIRIRFVRCSDEEAVAVLRREPDILRA